MHKRGYKGKSIIKMSLDPYLIEFLFVFFLGMRELSQWKRNLGTNNSYDTLYRKLQENQIKLCCTYDHPVWDNLAKFS